MKTFFYIFGVLLISAVSGCTTMSESECATADWHDIGIKDGRNGMPASYMEERRQDCSKDGISLDQKQYVAGRNTGILEYCTPQNGRLQGQQGRAYLNSCPANLEHDFLTNYEAGKNVYRAQRSVDDLNRQSEHVQLQLDKEKDGAKRQDLRKELREIDRQLNRAREALTDQDRRFRELR